ncbi:MAG: hypothetical protein ACOYJS_05360 [Acutalibacteraceae bacterium]|jgi:hypothetical protein
MNNLQMLSMLSKLLSGANGKIDPKTVADASNTGDPSKLLNSLSEEDRKKVNAVLSDKEALANILKSPQAAAIMKLLSGNDKNG